MTNVISINFEGTTTFIDYLPKTIANVLKILIQPTSNFDILEKIDEGLSSNIYKVIDEKGKVYALKEITSKTPDSLEEGRKEIEYLQKLSHHSEIIKLYNYKIDTSKIYLLLEYAPFDFFTLLRQNRINNKHKYYWKEMIAAVFAIHSHNIIHLDLKPENFVCINDRLKLIDFGFSLTLPKNSDTITINNTKGTVDFMSPERLISDNEELKICENIGKPADIWSLGCILYEMTYNRSIFFGYMDIDKITNICNPEYYIPYTDIGNTETVAVIKKCLSFEPEDRPSIEELFKDSII